MSRLIAAGVAGLLGAVLLVLGLQSGPARLRPGPTDFVNADRPGINAHNSPSVAVDPASASVIALADRIDTPRFSCSVSLSTTGGVSWRPLTLPLPDDAPNCHQPDVGYTSANHLVVLFTATGGRFNQPVGVWLQRFEGETPMGPAVEVAPAEAFHARMAVDGPRVWVTWVHAEGAAEKPLGFGSTPAPVRMARSVDGGATFSAPVTVSEGRRAIQPSPVFLGGERVVVGALDLAGDFMNYEARHNGQGGPPPEDRWRVVAWTSTDGGATFGPPATVAGDLIAPIRIIVNLAPAPSFAADPSRDGRLYAAWDAGQGDRRDVFLARSDDVGVTWSAPVAVGSRPGGQFLPAVGVSPLGRVDVVFYDRSGDPEDVRAQVTMESSADAGRTFRTATVSDAPFDTRIGFGSLQGLPVLGSRLAVLAEADRSLAFWSDTSRGTIDTNVQDLAAVSVDVKEAGRRRPALMVPGALLLGLGGGLAVVARLRPRDGGPQEA
ncbi:MAG TPA: sialidase family protein [Acidimicrobiales bacterium]|nr:sialidase family protein [Acidimicrobiales bacterium]